MAISAPEPLTAAHEVSEFSCGKPSLDRWLTMRALSNQEKGFTAVIVVLRGCKIGKICVGGRDRVVGPEEVRGIARRYEIIANSGIHACLTIRQCR